VLILESNISGEADDAEATALRAAIEQGVRAATNVPVITEAQAAERLGDDASCETSVCAEAIGKKLVAQVGVFASVNLEAEIYDFVITVFDLNSGAELTRQTGDCMFCPSAEAVDALRFATQAAIAAVPELPEASAGPAPVVVAPPTPEPATPRPTHRYLEGNIVFGVSAVPGSALIEVNGESVGNGSAQLQLAPQEIEVKVTAAGYEPYLEKVTLRPSMTGPIFMRIAMSEVPRAFAAPAAPERESRDLGDEPSFNHRAVGGVVLGTGIAALGGASRCWRSTAKVPAARVQSSCAKRCIPQQQAVRR
jgi:hypothetical protein